MLRCYIYIICKFVDDKMFYKVSKFVGVGLLRYIERDAVLYNVTLRLLRVTNVAVEE
jgi:hypothetical protein